MEWDWSRVGKRTSSVTVSRLAQIWLNWTRISAKVSVMTAMKTFFTSQARKKMSVVK